VAREAEAPAAFEGFPVAALDFYDDLELDNTRSFWAANKDTYEQAVRAPMQALITALGEEFGPGKLFRPYRDVRYSKDKTPYKDHQGGFVPAGPGLGWYVEVGAPGVRVSAGCFHADSPHLAAIRTAIADDRRGPALQRLLDELESLGLASSPSCRRVGHRRRRGADARSVRSSGVSAVPTRPGPWCARPPAAAASARPGRRS
jgi:uncharacterized protein (DUF2461 family)